MQTGKYQTLFDHFQDLKKRLADKNLTFREINLNTEIPEEFLRILFSDKNNLVSDLSKLFEFAKIDIRTRKKIFRIYKIYDDGEQIKITRVFEPKASVYYDRNTQKFYRFSFKRKRFEESSDVSKELIMNEMQLSLLDYFNNKK